MSNVQNVSRSLHVNQAHTQRYNMDKNRFKGGGSVGLAPVPHHRQQHLLDPNFKHVQRGGDKRNVQLEARRQQQFKASAVRLIHRRPFQ